ncbi:phage tail protein [Escherichia coli]|nr:phage tail protein [Escherichia coli]
MYKLKSLRKALTDAVPVLARNPDMMRVFIDNGNLASTLATSLSFENRYTLNVVVTDFTDDIELLLVPIQAWLRIHQADIMTTDEGRKKGFTYFADINDSVDVSISLMLTERTIVKESGDKLHVEQAEEPQPPEPVTRPVELYVNGELVSRLHE